MAFSFSGMTGDDDKRFILQEFGQRIAPLLARYRRTDKRPATWRSNRLSQHVFGTAADFNVPPGQISSFMREARALGLIPVNATTPDSPDWTGPHVHVQLFPRGVERTVINIPSKPQVQFSEAP